MRSKPWTVLVDGMKSNISTPAFGSGKFGPVIDEKIVFSNYSKRRDAGEFIKKVSNY
jgi:hypothetical protein